MTQRIRGGWWGVVAAAMVALALAVAMAPSAAYAGEEGTQEQGAGITAYVTVYGDTVHQATNKGGPVHTLLSDDLALWSAEKPHALKAGATVKDAIEAAAKAMGARLGYDRSGNYVESVAYQGVVLKQMATGPNAGWLYTLNGKRPGLSVSEQPLKANDRVILFWSDDFTREDTDSGNARADLGKAVSSADMLKQADYTPASWKAFDAALAAAKRARANGGATESQMREAATALLNARYGLMAKDISKAKVAVIADRKWTGKALAPAIEVASGGKLLAQGRDYTVSYADNVRKTDGTDKANKAAAAKVTVTGTGAFSGSKTASFEIVTWANEFPDTKAALGSKPWYVYEDYWLDYVAANGIMSGYKDSGNFGPFDNITRGQVATILYRAATNRTEATTEKDVDTGFADTPSGQYYSAAVKWAAGEGVVTGYEDSPGSGRYTNFGPDDAVTREQLATMIARYARKVGGIDISQASDSNLKGLEGADLTSPWAREGVVWCTARGVIGGIDNHNGSYSLKPQDTAWRASMAKIATVVLRDVLGK